ncbi:MAG: hypothetical protein KDB80_10985 [Planctomycetes bacterium]|nr:hypothetical protein [Planctomycetota bacterium]
MLRTLAAIVVILPSLAAQQAVSAEFSPAVGLPGGNVELKITDMTNAGRTLINPCGWLELHSGSPNGPSVFLGIICFDYVHQIAPGGSYSFLWDQTLAFSFPAPPDDYWFGVTTWDTNVTSPRTDWFCFRIQDADAPRLTPTNTARVGQPLLLDVDAPTHPTWLYGVLFSLTSNDIVDPLDLGLCVAPPIFVIHVDGLDANGHSGTTSFQIPPAPSLISRGFVLQGLLVDPAPAFATTNGVTMSIGP